MRVIKANNFMAIELLSYYAAYSCAITVPLMFLTYLLGILTLFVIGRPLDIFFFLQYKWISFIVFLFYYAGPGGIYAVKKLMNHEFSSFRTMTISKKKNSQGE